MAANDAAGTVLPEVADFGSRHGLSSLAQQELHGLMSASIVLSSQRVTVGVPATVANLGPGLESCGLAVDIWDEFTLEYSDSLQVEASGPYSANVPRSADNNLALQGAKLAFEIAGRNFPILRLTCRHHIPYNQGLGGPSASFVGGYLAGSALCAEELKALCPDVQPLATRPRSLADILAPSPDGSEVAADASPSKRAPQGSGLDVLLQRAIARGWNPGHVCPAIFGAFQVGCATPNGFQTHRVPLPNGLVCVVWVPDGHSEGQPLPKQAVDRKAAIFNVGRMALLTNCFCTGDFGMFSKATEDTLAQSHCESQFPFVSHVCQAASDAGAAGSFVCGYGPSCMALITGRTGDILAQSSFNELEHGVAKAMLKKGDELNTPGRVLIAKPADIGAHVLSQKSELGANLGDERIVYFQ